MLVGLTGVVPLVGGGATPFLLGGLGGYAPPMQRERLLGLAEPYIAYHARRHYPPQPLDADDLYQVGVLAAWRKTEGWIDSDRAYRNAAIMCARSAMIDEIRARRWGRRRHGGVGCPPPVTLESRIEAGDLTISDTLREPSNPQGLVDALDTLRRLPERTRRMVVMLGLGYTLEEIGDRHDISGSRVSQILTARRVGAA